MARVNRYYRFSKISEAKFRRLIRCFADDLTATETANRTRLSVRSVNAIFLRIRKLIAALQDHFYPNWIWLEQNYKEGRISEEDRDNLKFGSRAPRMIKFHGISTDTEYLHAKETEFRLGRDAKTIYKTLLFILRNVDL